MIIVSSSEFKTGRRSVRAAGHTAASLGCGKVKSRNYVGNWSGAWQVAMAMKASSWLFLSRRFLYFFMSLWLRQRGRVVRGEVIRFQWVDAQLQQSVTASDEEKKLEFVFFSSWTDEVFGTISSNSSLWQWHCSWAERETSTLLLKQSFTSSSTRGRLLSVDFNLETSTLFSTFRFSSDENNSSVKTNQWFMDV